jgi:hypothetical protein
MTLDNIVASMALGNIVVFVTIVVFVILLVAFLTSSPVMWRTEQLCNFSLHKGVHLSKLII